MIKRIKKWLGIPARDVTPADVATCDVQNTLSDCTVLVDIDVSEWDVSSVLSAAEVMEGVRVPPND